jgi:hypothetical protein
LVQPEDDWNTIVEIKKYLSTPDQPPMSNKEFMEFWNSLTEEEKDEFRKVELK